MKHIQIYNEVTRETTNIIVGSKDYKIIKSLQYKGGFKRFGLDIYDEGKHIKQASPEKDIVNVFSDIFANKPLIESTFLGQ